VYILGTQQHHNVNIDVRNTLRNTASKNTIKVLVLI